MSSQYAPVALLVVLLLVFWLVVLRPARRSQHETAQLQSELAVGDEVVLSAGIFGTVQALDDSKVQLEIAPGTVVTVARQVVVRRVQDLPDPSRSEPGAQDGPVDVPGDNADGRPVAGEE